MTIHFVICDLALPIIEDGRAAQDCFGEAMFAGISREEIEMMKRCHQRILENIYSYRKEEKNDV